jgi:hypothetical protein
MGWICTAFERRIEWVPYPLGSKPLTYARIETDKINKIDPQAWLPDVLGPIADHKITRLDELMPWHYAQL